MICKIHSEEKGYNVMKAEPQYCPYCKIAALTKENESVISERIAFSELMHNKVDALTKERDEANNHRDLYMELCSDACKRLIDTEAERDTLRIRCEELLLTITKGETTVDILNQKVQEQKERIKELEDEVVQMRDDLAGMTIEANYVRFIFNHANDVVEAKAAGRREAYEDAVEISLAHQIEDKQHSTAYQIANAIKAKMESL